MENAAQDLQELFHGQCSSGPSTEIVYKSDASPFKRHSRAARSDADYWPSFEAVSWGMLPDEGLH